jgi:ribosomal protein L32
MAWTGTNRGAGKIQKCTVCGEFVHMRDTHKHDREKHRNTHGNLQAREGVDRCPCGAKYWEHDVCVSCGSKFDPGYCAGCGTTFNGARGLRAHQNSPFQTLDCKGH